LLAYGWLEAGCYSTVTAMAWAVVTVMAMAWVKAMV
jgi:hypothetical protein